MQSITNSDVGHNFRVPSSLNVNGVSPSKILMVGSCLIESLPSIIKDISPETEADYVLFNNLGNLPAAPPQPIDGYSLQVVQIPLRAVLADIPFYRADYTDPANAQQLFRDAEDMLFQLLSGIMRWNVEHGILTVVMNFMAPQQNPMGRLLPKYDLSNAAYFVNRLNESLARELSRYKNAYVLDVDDIAATFGKKYIQDDVLFQINHGSFIGDAYLEEDQKRLHPL